MNYIIMSYQQDGFKMLLNEAPLTVFFPACFLKSIFLIDTTAFHPRVEILYLLNPTQSDSPFNTVTITTITTTTITNNK